MNEQQVVGIVKWFDTTKGFGFIGVDGFEKDIFVHYSAIEGNGRRDLFEGEKVEFVVTQGKKGPQAQGVRKV